MKVYILLSLAVLLGFNSVCGMINNKISSSSHNNLPNNEQLYELKDQRRAVLARIPLKTMKELSSVLGDHTCKGYIDQYSLTLAIEDDTQDDAQEDDVYFFYDSSRICDSCKTRCKTCKSRVFEVDCR